MSRDAYDLFVAFLWTPNHGGVRIPRTFATAYKSALVQSITDDATDDAGPMDPQTAFSLLKNAKYRAAIEGLHSRIIDQRQEEVDSYHSGHFVLGRDSAQLRVMDVAKEQHFRFLRLCDGEGAKNEFFSMYRRFPSAFSRNYPDPARVLYLMNRSDETQPKAL